MIDDSSIPARNGNLIGVNSDTYACLSAGVKATGTAEQRLPSWKTTLIPMSGEVEKEEV